LAQKYFDANFTVDGLGTTHHAGRREGRWRAYFAVGHRYRAHDVLAIVGVGSLDLGVRNEVSRSVTKLRVALVLDNTGSMSQTDVTGTSKISALKTATHQLLTQLRTSRSIPAMSSFHRSLLARREYRNANVNANWIDGRIGKNAPNAAPSPDVGPASACPYTNANDGFKCASSAANDKNCNLAPTTPASPSFLRAGTSVLAPIKRTRVTAAAATSTMAAGTARQTQRTLASGLHACRATTPTPGAVASWTATRATIPPMQRQSRAMRRTMFPAENNAYWPAGGAERSELRLCDVERRGRSDDPQRLDQSDDRPCVGWQALTSTNPLNAPAQDPTVQNVIVLLSDGLNTQNRFAGDGSNTSSAVDNRMALACANAKAAKIRIYTVAGDGRQFQRPAILRHRFAEIFRADHGRPDRHRFNFNRDRTRQSASVRADWGYAGLRR